MKNVLIILYFNLFWVIFFSLFQFFTMIKFKSTYGNNTECFTPKSVTEYKKRGGKKMDYYAGYIIYTSNVATTNHFRSDKWKLSVKDKTVLRYLYLLSIGAIWILGFMLLDRIYVYKKWIMEPSSYERKNKEKPSRPSVFYYFLATFTTAISIYGMYYTIIYVSHFWLT